MTGEHALGNHGQNTVDYDALFPTTGLLGQGVGLGLATNAQLGGHSLLR